MIADLAARTDPSNGPTLLVGNGKSENHLLIVVSADRGLCGVSTAESSGPHGVKLTVSRPKVSHRNC